MTLNRTHRSPSLRQRYVRLTGKLLSRARVAVCEEGTRDFSGRRERNPLAESRVLGRRHCAGRERNHGKNARTIRVPRTLCAQTDVTPVHKKITERLDRFARNRSRV